jgi:hypothetical protein
VKEEEGRKKLVIGNCQNNNKKMNLKRIASLEEIRRGKKSVGK